jgi:hypothetical protein
MNSEKMKKYKDECKLSDLYSTYGLIYINYNIYLYVIWPFQ